MADLIDRAKAIKAIEDMQDCYNGFSGTYDKAAIIGVLEDVPSAQPERLTDDDFETIRIHLSAYKEKLCNQNRWKEAEEYQRIIDRFMAFASAHPEPQVIRCKNCKHSTEWYRDKRRCFLWCEDGIDVFEDGFCNYGDSKGGEQNGGFDRQTGGD